MSQEIEAIPIAKCPCLRKLSTHICIFQYFFLFAFMPGLADLLADMFLTGGDAVAGQNMP